MGGVKRKAKVVIKKESKYKIPTRFDCPLCDAKNSIGVKLYRSREFGVVHCRSCQAGKGMEFALRPLEIAVDVFFRFREDLVKQDREYLKEQNIETKDAAAVSALEQLAAPLVPQQQHMQYAAAAPRGIDLDEGFDDNDNDSEGDFAVNGARGTYAPYMGSAVSQMQADEDYGSRAVDAVLGKEMDDLLMDDDHSDRYATGLYA